MTAEAPVQHQLGADIAPDLDRILPEFSDDEVIDLERITGVRERPFEVAVVYEVVDGLIRCMWSYPDE